MKKLKNFNRIVYEIVMQIPKGRVMYYGQISRLAGSPRASRAVGYALHANPDPENIPCHRVVFKDGSLTPSFVFGGIDRQYKLLKAEKVTFTKDKKVKMEKHNLTEQKLKINIFKED
ncbi:MAG: MGMT family protein [Endomicrobium sp.]|jgi:methylated-DNA-protein-cysteine methyltransferase-like protein|nr:MGMT family protein [Endomicrobium sp.]